MASNNKHISTRVSDEINNRLIGEKIKISLHEEFKNLSAKSLEAIDYIINISEEASSQLLHFRGEFMKIEDIDLALSESLVFKHFVEKFCSNLETQSRLIAAMNGEFLSRRRIVEKVIDKFCKTKKEKSLEIGGAWPAIEEK